MLTYTNKEKLINSMDACVRACRLTTLCNVKICEK